MKVRRLDRLEAVTHDPAAVAAGVHALRAEGTRSPRGVDYAPCLRPALRYLR